MHYPVIPNTCKYLSMKRLILSVLTLAALFSCGREGTGTQTPETPAPGALSALVQANPEWTHENLRLVPVVADQAFIGQNAAAAGYLTMEEAIKEYYFRISEKMPFGRFADHGSVLTAQNKLKQPVFLMSGDVVEGGRQDRVIAEDQVIAANRIKDVPVFCVEHSRWSYNEPDEVVAAASETQRRKIFAFSGYYHVAANDIRKTLQDNEGQEAVWAKVDKFRAAHSVTTPTQAYTGLETADDYTNKRDAYLDFFAGKFDGLENAVGVMAISGDRIMAVDVFGHPDLFRRQLPSLLHSYVTEAVTYGAEAKGNEKAIQLKMNEVNKGIAGDKSKGAKFENDGHLVHFSSLSN